MYRFLVIFVVFVAVNARASFVIENAPSSNHLDFGEDEKEPSWPVLKPNNASSVGEFNAFLLAHLTAVSSAVDKVEGTMRYTLGKRVQNDGMVGYTSDTKVWEKPQDVTLTLKYPTTGQGASVTCVEIIMGQSSKLGEAKVTAGGIGQRSIVIAVTARSTTYVNYVAYFYGM